MMRLSRSMVSLLLTVLSATLLVGCQPPAPKPVPAPAPQPATPEQAAMVQTDILKAFPGAVVGHVSAVTGKQAAVYFGNPAPAVRAGESVQFTDGSSNPIANGQIFSLDVTNSEYPIVVVDVETLPSGRAPVTGDLAIYVPTKH